MAKTYLGVDIGGHKIGVGLIKKNKVITYEKFPTQAQTDQQKIIKNIINAITAVKKNQQIAGIGVGIAGQVDHQKGIFIFGPNFSKKFTNIPLAKILKKEFKCRVRLENDATCFTMAEAALGQGKPYHHIAGVTLGTGVGGGIIIDGLVYRGADGLAGEFGHTFFGESTFENSAAGKAMIALYKKKTKKTANSFQIEELAKKKDKVALAVFAELSTGLAKGLVNISTTINPEIIVLGGGLIRVPLLIKPALQKYKKLIPFKPLKNTKIIISKLGDTANVLGATILFR